MPTKTDLEMVKKFAKILIYLELKPAPDMPMFIEHPYATSSILYKNGKTLNLLESEEDRKIWENDLTKRIDNIDRYDRFALLITKPYRSVFLSRTLQYIDKKDLSKYLKTLWITCDYVNVDKVISKSKYVSLFQKADKSALMNEDEIKRLDALPDSVTIYRGINDITNHPIDGLSWTLDIDTANWFANRFAKMKECTASVYKATIKKEDILSYFDDEKEVVVDYKKLENVEKINGA